MRSFPHHRRTRKWPDGQMMNPIALFSSSTKIHSFGHRRPIQPPGPCRGPNLPSFILLPSRLEHRSARFFVFRGFNPNLLLCCFCHSPCCPFFLWVITTPSVFVILNGVRRSEGSLAICKMDKEFFGSNILFYDSCFHLRMTSGKTMRLISKYLFI